jgi:hypothetical protein
MGCSDSRLVPYLLTGTGPASCSSGNRPDKEHFEEPVFNEIDDAYGPH